LIDIGVKPFLVASSIQAIMAQRLIRIICPDCKEPYPNPDPKMLRMLGFREDELANVTFMRGRGCNTCHGSGYRGRQGIFELMEMNTTLREMAFNQAQLKDIRRAARSAGMRALLEDGKLKVRRGVTTPEELLSVTQVEELVTE
jgi:type IV pilus assembly protein PilB